MKFIEENVVERASYDVSLDPASLTGEEVTVGNDGAEGMQYTLRLQGNADEHWTKAFRFIQLNSTGFFRFRLSRHEPSVAFTCRQGESMDEVHTVVSRLQSFLTLVNRTASSGDFEGI
jgi:hypothetical protein